MFVRSWLLLVTLCLACSDDGPSPDLSVEANGPYTPATASLVLTDTARSRVLPTQIWYPAAAADRALAETGFPVEDYLEGAARDRMVTLLAAADPACPTRRAHAAVGAAMAPGQFPLVGFSHCHECTRFSNATVAERLASHGFVVIAVDHVGNTLWDQPTGLPLDTTTLATRVADLQFALAAAVGGLGPLAPFASGIDIQHVGVLGHSFGAVTVGKLAQNNPNIAAALALAAPMQNPLLPGVDVTMIDRPLGFVVAVEDNSITELGNNLIRDNFDMAPNAAWKAEVADAGHWSVSDLVGLTPGFAPGCGAGRRQTDDQPFTYLDPSVGRGLTAAYATAFFRAYLLDDAGAATYLDQARPATVVTIARHP